MKKFILWGLVLLAGCILFFNEIFSEQHSEKMPLQQTIEGRFEQEYLMTVDPNLNVIPRERLLKAYKIAQLKRAARASDDLAVYWEERGPNNVGGRTRGILVDANDPTGQTVWLGSVSGGLWRTSNIDANPPTWTAINDLFLNLAVSSIAQDPTNSNNMYFGTGECWGNQDAVRGLGVWSSTDGGASWNQMPLGPFGVFPCVVRVDVTNTGLLIATTTNGLFQFNAMTLNWTPLGDSPMVFVNNNVTDFEIASNGDFYAATRSDGVYISTNAGANWNPINTGLPTSNFGRVELALAPSNSSIAYVAFADTTSANSGACLSVFTTNNSGANWTPATCPGSFGTQAWYDFILAVDPTDATRPFFGGVRLFVSDDSGGNWTQIGGIHADHHQIMFQPGDATQLLFGHDGGIDKSYDAQNSPPAVTSKDNSYNVTQFYALAVHPDPGSDYMLGGTQDNGTQQFTSPGIGPTTTAVGADGGWCFIDQDNPDIQIASTQCGNFRVSNDGGGSFASIVPSSTPRLFITPADYDDAADVLYFSDTCGFFGRINDVGAANTVTFEDVSDSIGCSRFTALKASPNIANRVYMGTGQALYQIDNADQNGAITIANLGGPVPGGFMSSIEVEPGNENHILITYSNYGVTSVWETIDGGVIWNPIEGDLPDMPIRWIIFWPGENDKAMVATEIGVWYAKDLDGANTEWYPTNEFGLANVRVDMLESRGSDNQVTAATHGRGFYTTDYFTLLDSCEVSFNLSGNISPGLYMASEFITSDGTVASGDAVIYRAGEEIELLADFTAERGSNFWGLIKECTPLSNFNLKNNPDQGNQTDDLLLTNQLFPNELTLDVYPNPARTSGNIEYHIPKPGRVDLYLMNAQGHYVERWFSGTQEPGEYYHSFEISKYPPGTYLVVLKTNGKTKTEQIIIVN